MANIKLGLSIGIPSATDWLVSGVQMHVYSVTGFKSHVTSSNYSSLLASSTNGIGIIGNTTPGNGGPNNEIGYNPITKKSEQIVLTYAKDISHSAFVVNNFYDGTTGTDQHKNEVLKVSLYSNGVLIASSAVVADGTVSNATDFNATKLGNGKLSFSVISNVVYDKIVLSALPYDSPTNAGVDKLGQKGITNDSSDFSLQTVDSVITPHNITLGGTGQTSGDWLKDGIKLMTVTADGETVTHVNNFNFADAIAVNPNGIGVAGNTTNSHGPDNETGYDPRTNTSEVMSISFGHVVTGSQYHITNFADAAIGYDHGQNEMMEVMLFLKGKLVASGEVTADGVTTNANFVAVNNHDASITLTISGVNYDQVVLSALPYDAAGVTSSPINTLGQGAFLDDSSDFSLKSVNYTYESSASSISPEMTVFDAAPGGGSLHGNNASNILYGDSKSTALFGLAGDDLMYLGNGKNTFAFGGIGNDVIVGGSGNDTIYAEKGNDKIFAGSGGGTLSGGVGNDTIYGSSGDDMLIMDGRLFVQNAYVAEPTLYKTSMGASTQKQFLEGGTDTFYGGTGNNSIDLRGTNSVPAQGPKLGSWDIHIDNGTAGGINITSANYTSYMNAATGNIDVHALSNGHGDSGYIKTTLQGSNVSGENGLYKVSFTNVQTIHIDDMKFYTV